MFEHLERLKEQCPDCGCYLSDHNAVNRVPRGLVAHCGMCGACWNSINSEFTERLRIELGERSQI